MPTLCSVLALPTVIFGTCHTAQPSLMDVRLWDVSCWLAVPTMTEHGRTNMAWLELTVWLGSLGSGSCCHFSVIQPFRPVDALTYQAHDDSMTPEEWLRLPAWLADIGTLHLVPSSTSKQLPGDQNLTGCSLAYCLPSLPTFFAFPHENAPFGRP